MLQEPGYVDYLKIVVISHNASIISCWNGQLSEESIVLRDCLLASCEVIIVVVEPHIPHSDGDLVSR